MVILKDQYDTELRKKIKLKPQVAIIPIGSLEQHGPHLPISTDSDIVTEISKRISEKGDYLLVPTINFGVSFEHAPFFNLSIQEKNIGNFLLDVCVSLRKNGVAQIIIINGHHGNISFLENLSKSIRRIRIPVNIFSYWKFMSLRFDHAGEVETSLMLAISKKVRMKKAERGLLTDHLDEKETRKLGKLASKSFPKVTKNGIWGDPTRATAKKGNQILNEIVKNLGNACQTCLIKERQS